MNGRLLGQGMEGAVYEIDDERVAKVWHTAGVEALRRTAAFCDALGAMGLPFAVPEILEVTTVGVRGVTIERRRGGADLHAVALPMADGIVVEILRRLAAAGPIPAARQLLVLGTSEPMFRGDEDFPAALAGLAARRVTRFRPPVPLLAELAAALPGRLRDVDSGRRAPIHGDLVPANIQVEPLAVLDWGFLTTEGDPVFDAAVTAAIFDMYGPGARRTEDELLERFEGELGCDRTAMLVYRAAYCLITANAYDAEGRDGHYAWCAEGLRRPEVVAALLG